MLIAAEELGTEGAKAYAFGNEYGFLPSEAASAAASLSAVPASYRNL